MSDALLADARRALEHMPAVLEALLSGLDHEAARTRPAPNEWSPVEIICLGPLSGLDLVAAWVAHDRIHLAQLAGALARNWASRWAPLRSEYAGPIPYPTSV